MGFGDYLLLSGRVRQLKKCLPGVQVGAPHLEGRHFFESIFKNNPLITRQAELDKNRPWVIVDQVQLGQRDDAQGLIRWSDEIDPIRGDLHFDDQELTEARDSLAKQIDRFECKFGVRPQRVIFCAPTATAGRVLNGKHVVYAHSVNKEWPRSKWEELISRQPHDIFVSTGPADFSSQLPSGMFFIENDFRQACAVLSICDIFVGIEGGLHHAAAALQVPSVVFFGHWISPLVSGYGGQINLTWPQRRYLGCGSLTPCSDCLNWMENLSPETVSNLISLQT